MNPKIKVLHIIKNLNLGGAEVNLLNLLQETDQDHFELHLAYSLGGELEPKFKKQGIKLFKYAQTDEKVKSPATIAIVAKLVAYIRKNKIRIVHTHTFSAHLWGSAAAKLTGCRIIEHVHDFRYLEPEDFFRRRGFNNQYKFVKKFRNVSDRVVVLTKQNKEFLIKEDIYPSDRIREYQNGIPLPNRQNDKEKARRGLIDQFKLRPDAFIILTPIRLAPEKNADLIVRIAPEVVRQVPQAVFLIAGDGPLYQETNDAIQKAGLPESVLMIGYQKDISYLLQGTDVFLLPSFLELHSIAILEAMSMRVPVVISENVGCNSEFIEHGRNGFLRDPFSDAGWSESIIELLKSPELGKKIGEAGFRTCQEKFDICRVADQFEKLYVELTSK